MTFNVMQPMNKPEYFSQKLETMKTSILIDFIAQIKKRNLTK
jgi:hypothetical protein